jgi:hypothetical protein
MPELVQFSELRSHHFERHPVWVGCHTVDYDEPWYEDTNEETFRPCVDATVKVSRNAILLVRADARLADGTLLDAFLTPTVDEDIKANQPHIISADSAPRPFWYGRMRPSDQQRSLFYVSLNRGAAQVFPIVFSPRAGLTPAWRAIAVHGFCSLDPTTHAIRVDT